MKQLELNQMENLNGGEVCFNHTASCYIGLTSVGLSLFSLFTGVGTVAGLAALASLANTMPACFDCASA